MNLVMNNYSVTIEKSSKDLTHKERLMVMDTANAIKFPELLKDGPAVIKVNYYVTLKISNDDGSRSYTKYVVIDDAGRKYITGSESFISALDRIYDEMEGSDEEYRIMIIGKPSKNYPDKVFYTCSIV